MKQVRACLWMEAGGGAYPIPTSEVSYRANIALIDVALPCHGGRLLVDGTWMQEPNKLHTEFAQVLPSLAHDCGQWYVPTVSANDPNVPGSLATILTSTDLQEKAIGGLLELATTRFDAPWDGISWGTEHIVGYQQEYDEFLLRLSCEARAAGLSFEVAYRGILPGFQSAISLKAISQAADVFDNYMYSWWEEPKSTSPYWWADAAIANAISEGVPAQRICLGLPLFARYWPVTGQDRAYVVTHAQAMDLIHDHNGFVQWIESHPTGIIREKYADVGKGHIWLHDGDTLRQRLALVDQQGLAGVMLFVLGMESESVWQAIAEWKQPAAPAASKPTDFFTVAPTGAGEVMS